MSRNALRQELSNRFAAVLKEDSAALPVLQRLVEDTRVDGVRTGDHWTGPFSRNGSSRPSH